ncbi:MAG: hypothetical protein COT81_03435 [Candidatus Buchananbacteria bacterium CG10_big_fil_rev_8_21_14_0_10_42_9]|uniref:V-type proton ATPase subunit E n=1 Tax=Candidatus Buchananbacteria bacterium CG10_big_fil_rev_8_21_14_0_10_42_9 TaxID=1974526 RepID=A0A2H0W385_9BACT|nr:MAG: hypothetical protein COT81_03435 [Candidatus Buchananbacteria bacterium CG10_big_fil_rev_8_21_14_0_10_42_9]
MALQDIVKAIEKQTLSETAKIDQQKEHALLELRKSWEQKIKARKAEIIAQAKIKAQKKVQQADFTLASQRQAAILQKKQAVIDEVFKQALAKLSSLNDSEYEKQIVKLIKALPQGIDGEVIPVKGKESITKKALKASGKNCKVGAEALNGGGGFVFQSQDVMIDSRFDELIATLKSELTPEVANIIFG